MAKYRIRIKGGAIIGNSRDFEPGEILETDIPYHKMFKESVELMPTTAPVTDTRPSYMTYNRQAEVQPVVEEEEEDCFPEELEKKEPEKPFRFRESKCVNGAFPLADTAGLAVYQDGFGRFAITERTVLKPFNLAGKPLKTVKEVNAFLRKRQPPKRKD